MVTLKAANRPTQFSAGLYQTPRHVLVDKVRFEDFCRELRRVPTVSTAAGLAKARDGVARVHAVQVPTADQSEL